MENDATAKPTGAEITSKATNRRKPGRQPARGTGPRSRGIPDRPKGRNEKKANPAPIMKAWSREASCDGMHLSLVATGIATQRWQRRRDESLPYREHRSQSPIGRKTAGIGCIEPGHASNGGVPETARKQNRENKYQQRPIHLPMAGETVTVKMETASPAGCRWIERSREQTARMSPKGAETTDCTRLAGKGRKHRQTGGNAAGSKWPESGRPVWK